jgi:hypothetical protein
MQFWKMRCVGEAEKIVEWVGEVVAGAGWWLCGGRGRVNARRKMMAQNVRMNARR